MGYITLSEARTRDAKQRVSTAALGAFKAHLKSKIIELVDAEYARTEFAWIADANTKVFEDYLAQGLDDCFYDVETEIEA